MEPGAVVIPKVWRSELGALVVFFILCIASVVVSQQFPQTVIRGELFRLGGFRVNLSLPAMWLMPASALIYMVLRIYNVRYLADSRGLEAIYGIFSLNQKIARIRYEDIRSVETEQTIVGRMLDVGDVEIGTAATAGVEVVLGGIGAPREVQEMIQAERDKRQRAQQRATQTVSVATSGA